MSGTDTNEQLKQFWNQTLIPIIRQLEDKLNTDVSRRWTPTVKYTFDLADIAELQDDIGTTTERISKQIAAVLLTINEGRELLGRDPVGWGDTWYKPLNLTPVDEPAPGAEPAKQLEIFAQPKYTQRYKYGQWLAI